MANQPHIERVVKEKEALDALRAKLEGFLSGEIFSQLAADDQALLKVQASVMQQYSEILAKRLARFPK